MTDKGNILNMWKTDTTQYQKKSRNQLKESQIALTNFSPRKAHRYSVGI